MLPAKGLLKRSFQAGCVLFLLESMAAGWIPVQAASQPAVALANNPTWLEKAAMPVYVTAYGDVLYGDNIYVIGGNNGTSDTTTVQRYSPATNTWAVDTAHGGSLAPLPQPRAFGFFCGVLSGKIHCLGGWQNGVYKSDHFIFDPSTNSWTTGPSLPSSPIGQFALATVRFKLIARPAAVTTIQFQAGTDAYFQGQSVLGQLYAGQVTCDLPLKVYMPMVVH